MWSSPRIAAALLGLVTFASFAGCAASGDLPDEADFDDDGGPGAILNEGDAQTHADGEGTRNPPPGPGGDGGADGAATGNPLGFPCTKPEECASGDCKAVLAGSATSLCVGPCTAQSDCPDNFFCNPETPGGASGSCVPRSPAHCKTCNTSDECGALSETCGTAEGDIVKACHVDCSIAGDAACPPDYTCTTTTLDGATARVCRPQNNISCLDSLGGYCDRVATPQSCARANAAGTCVGQRSCLGASTRFDTCGASAPACKSTCSTTDPAGCTTSYCEEATAGPQNCGACGIACPGLGTANANVGCNQPTCTFSCKGESYDVNNNPANGCEVTDPVTGNHSTNTAVDLGDHGCKDSDKLTFTGHLPSDSRLHENPAVAGFDLATGSAPDFFKVRGTGSALCTNQVAYTLTVSGSTYPHCYNLTVTTDRNVYSCNTDAAGTCSFDSGGYGKYTNDSTIFFVVSKRDIAGCSATFRDKPTYTVSGHF
jgi:hypothetical protein